ncbi:MAG: ATP-binding protein [Bacteroidetes bacterium]|nr:ATP-binding protein [Bacteroidota bacterium]
MNIPIPFIVRARKDSPPSGTKNLAVLSTDRWDDWSQFETQYDLTIYDAGGDRRNIGQVKIGWKGLVGKARPGTKEEMEAFPDSHRYPPVPKEFIALDDKFFSLGQSDEYYKQLNELGAKVRDSILRQLRDIAFDSEILDAVRHEDVLKVSLMRGFSFVTVEGQFKRMARGGAQRTPYHFTYAPPKRLGEGAPPYQLEFSVVPEKEPPSNVHVLIGRNGVGKTHLLALMTKALVAPDKTAQQSGAFTWKNDGGGSRGFASVVAVAFSAFDNHELLSEEEAKRGTIRYTYIGLRDRAKDDQRATKPKSVDALVEELVNSMALVREQPRLRRWLEAMSVLKSDPIFNSLEIDTLLGDGKGSFNRSRVKALFKELSSGHKIVLLTVTRLVETIEEKSLVLLDEPESHLHPPLLAAFVRALSDLLADRNGVAIIATHSPVILQEVPKQCVWKINRFGKEQSVERPVVETFGENIGVLTREVFQLELAQSGYQKVLEQAVRNNPSYEQAVFHFGDQLGMEARSILRALYAVKASDYQGLA